MIGEEHWQQVFELLDVGVTVSGRDARFVYANQKAVALLALSASEITDRTADDARWDVITPDGTAVSDGGLPVIRALRTGEPVRGVTLGVRRGDAAERVWLLVSAVPRRGADGAVDLVVASFSDISVAQRALREQEALYQTVFRSMSEGVAVHNADGTIREVNAAAEQVLGLTVDQMTGRAATDPRWRLIATDGAPLAAGAIPSEIARTTGCGVAGTILGVHRPSGELAWLEVRADPLRDPRDDRLLGVVATFADVTRPRETQLALESTRAHLQRVLDAVPGVVYQYLHPPQGPDRFTFVGGRIAEVLGLDPERVREDPGVMFSLLAPEDRDRLVAEIARTVAAADPFNYEVCFSHPEGGERWARIRGAPTETADGLLYTGAFFDVTETHRLADALQQTQRRELIAQMAAGIAHNFNNMLAVIVPNLEAARERLPAADRPMLEDAQKAACSAADLVRRMLQLGQTTPADSAGAVDLVPLVREALHICRQTFDRSIEIEERVSVGAAFVRGDLSQLQQVLLNLCLNARDAMAGVEHPRLTVTLDEERPGIVVLVIADTGRGMAPETLERIGEPFFTTKGPGVGTGLGLASAFRTLSEARGDWTIRSRPGAGTTFTVRLPIVDPADDVEPPPPVRITARPDGAVLLVDDEPLVREALRRPLEDAGYEVITAETADAALDVLAAGAVGNLRAILLDLSMPGTPGSVALPRFRALAPPVPVIVISGYPDATPSLASAALVLQKPVTGRQLVEAVAQVTEAAGA